MCEAVFSTPSSASRENIVNSKDCVWFYHLKLPSGVFHLWWHYGAVLSRVSPLFYFSLMSAGDTIHSPTKQCHKIPPINRLEAATLQANSNTYMISLANVSCRGNCIQHIC